MSNDVFFLSNKERRGFLPPLGGARKGPFFERFFGVG
jgi:hypothetical protein